MYYVVQIYWPREQQYGGGSHTFSTLAEAQAYAETDKRMGYGCKRCPIHIIECTPDKIVQVIDDQPDKAEIPRRRPTRPTSTGLPRKDETNG